MQQHNVLIFFVRLWSVRTTMFFSYIDRQTGKEPTIMPFHFYFTLFLLVCLPTVIARSREIEADKLD